MSSTIEPSFGRDMGTRAVAIEELRGDLSVLSRGVVDAELLQRLENIRAQRRDRRLFAGVVVGPGRDPLDLNVQEVGGDDDDPRQLPVAMIVGRHSQCDFARVAGASLRHAALLAHPPRGGVPGGIEAIDLATGVGLGTGDATGSLRLTGERQLRFGVGKCTVLAFFAEPHEPFFPDGPQAALAELNAGAQGRGAFVTLAADDRDLPQGRPRLAIDVQVPWNELGRRSMLRVKPTYEVWASEGELEGGILLGRFERCHGHEDFRADTRVSRVHALLLRRGGRTLLVDCGSYNGTIRRGPGADVAELGPGRRVASLTPGDRFEIGSFTLRWVPRL